jgi:hypothetical protein
VNYPEISDDIPELIDGLIETGLLHSGKNIDYKIRVNLNST